MTTRTPYPLEIVGQEIIAQMRADAYNVREAFRNEEYRKTGPICYAARQVIDCYEAAAQVQARLWNHAREEREEYRAARWLDGAAYVERTIRAMPHMAAAAEITADLILWSIQVRPFAETARAALM